MDTILELTYKRTGDDEEVVDTNYCDLHDLQADFLCMTQEEPENFDYVAYRVIQTDYVDYEEVLMEDCWYK